MLNNSAITKPNKPVFHWILTTFLSDTCNGIYPIKPNPDKPRNWSNFKQNDGVNGFVSLNAVLHTPHVRHALNRSNALPIAVKLNAPYIAIDIDYPYNSTVVQDIIAYLADNCLSFKSRNGNAHIICKLTDSYYQALFEARKIINGQLRYSNGNPLVHPSDASKKTEFSIKSVWINNDLGIDSTFKVINYLNSNGLSDNEKLDYFNEIDAVLIDALLGLGACDDKLDVLLKCHYPVSAETSNNGAYINNLDERCHNSNIARQNSNTFNGFSFSDNIAYCQKLYNSEWSLWDNSDSSQYIYSIAKKVTGILAKYGNCSHANVEHVLRVIIPDYLQGKYTRKHSQGYSRVWLDKAINAAINSVRGAK